MEPNRIYKTPLEDPSYFGAYLNLAMHNAFIVLTHINETFIEEKTATKEEDILKMPLFEAIKTPGSVNKDILSSIYTAINRYFPFLEYMVEGKLRYLKVSEKASEQHVSYFGEILELLIKNLNDYRNYYSHFIGGQEPQDSILVKRLYNAFDTSRVTVRERFNYLAEDVNHLVRLGKDRKEKISFKYSFLEEGRALSDTGLYYLICLFLRPHDSQLFLKKIKGFKRDDDKKFKATIHCFTANSIKLPNKTITSDDSKKGLLLDIANELAKCPSVLFNHLSKEAQEKFRPVLENEDEENEVLMKRYQNRFVELALNYFDKYEVLPNFRFLVKYGRFYYRHDEKKYFDEKYIRWLTKDLYAFSSMTEIKAFKSKLKEKGILKKTTLAPNVYLNQEELKPYIDDRQPEFVQANNQILISTNPQPTDIEKIVSSKSNGMYSRPVGVVSQDMNDVVSMSIYDIPGMLLFYLMVNRKGNAIEGRINKWRTTFVKFIEFVKKDGKPDTDDFEKWLNEKYQLKSKDIPKSILNHFTEDNKNFSWQHKIKGILQNMIDETAQFLKKIDTRIKNRQKTSDRNSKTIESGYLADLLARDMVFFIRKQPEIKKIHKPSSSEFKQLQKTMAFWGRYQEQLIPLMKSINLFDYHPFLDKSMINGKGIYDFFKKYLNEKEEYLKKIISKKSIHTDDVIFLNIPNSRDVKQICNDILTKHHLSLPRGFFNDECQRKLTDSINTTEKNSIGYIFEKWKTDSKKQDFYTYKRGYELINKWTDKRKGREKFKSISKKYTDTVERENILNDVSNWLKSDENEKQFAVGDKKPKVAIKKNLRYVLSTERKIRLAVLQDQLLFEVIKTELEKETNLKGLDEFTLNDMDTALNKVVSLSLEYDKNGHIIVDSSMKIKDYGKFQQLLRDRRLKFLLDYFSPSSKIERSYLLKELELYEKCRLEVLKAVYKAEERIYAKYESYFDQIKENDTNGIISHYKYLDKLEIEGIIDVAQKEQMREMRNKFSHNQYPRKKIIERVSTIDLANSIAEQLSKIAVNYYSNLEL